MSSFAYFERRGARRWLIIKKAAESGQVWRRQVGRCLEVGRDGQCHLAAGVAVAMATG